MYKKTTMRNRKIGYVLSIAVLLSTLMLLVPVQPAKAQFVLAYDYSEDNYGNAIAYISAYFDGEFNGTMYMDPDSYPTNTASSVLETYEGINITLAVFCWLNGTYAGIASLGEGQSVIRHNVSVALTNGTVIFSQQNFTYVIGGDGSAPMYFYRYDIDLDIIPLSGQVYYVTVVYEVFGM